MSDSPTAPTPRLVDAVRLQFRINHVNHRANANGLMLSPGDEVIVHTDQGRQLATIKGPTERQTVSGPPLPRVLRKLTERDRTIAEDNEQLERRALRFALEAVEDLDLSMKLIRVQAMHGGSRLLFYFTADQRVDFRALVRRLAAEFQTRIEMVQIGVRDSTQLIGGIGPCGRELCCSTFLDDFQPISIRMARQQGLTISPDKLTGMCGRLMCCLVYEQKVYRRLRSALPRAGQSVSTPDGEATVREVNLISKELTVALEDGATRRFHLRDVDRAAPARPSPEDLAPLWDGDPPRKR